MEKFNVNVKTTVGLCDAKRCANQAEHILNNGVKLCNRHFQMLTESEINEYCSADKKPKTDDTKKQALAIIQPAQVTGKEFLTVWQEYEIADAADADLAGECRKEIHDKIKELEDARKSITQPLQQAKTATDKLFKPTVKLLTEVKDLIGAKLTSYILEQERLQNERLLAATQESEIEADFEDDDEIAEFEAAITLPKGVATKRIWTFKVDDFSLIPREYLILDEAKIRELIRNENPEEINIPGITVYHDTRCEVAR